MKVIVRCANNRVTKAEMEREIERLFQENKDLRVYISHLYDELSLIQQQSEARRQVICERDKLIQELNNQITACEEELTEANKILEKKSAALAQVSAQRDSFEASYKEVCERWGNEQTKAHKEAETAKQMADEYARLYQEKEKSENDYLNIISNLNCELSDRDARVDELERRILWMEDDNEKIGKERDALWEERNVLRAQVKQIRYESDTELKSTQLGIEMLKTKNEEYEDTIAKLKEEVQFYKDGRAAANAERYRLEEELQAMINQQKKNDEECDRICKSCNELYEDVLAERNHLRSEVVRLTTERNTVVKDNSELINENIELRDELEAEHNLRAEAEKAYDKVASEAYDMHQQITNLTIDNTRLENKVEELEAEVDACHRNIDGYIEGNRRMRAEYEKKLETEPGQTKHWYKKHDEVFQKMEGYKTQLIVANQENLARAKVMEQLQEEYNELEANFDELERVHKLWGEEIDRLRRVVTELQTNRFTTDEFIGMIMKNFMPSADK